ncbi:MAG TPA: hypothetical protein PLA25_12505, partial [Anaerolineaceae bacterium]|nr:hypothetical protein [Anaerolineaceae bacterium]
MNKHLIVWLAMLIGFSLVLAACTPAAGPQATPQPEAQSTTQPGGEQITAPVEHPTALPPTEPPRPEANQVISPENGAQLALLNILGKGNVTSSAWSPDGSRVAVGAGYGIYIYDRRTLEALMFIDTHSYITAVMYSPDGSQLFSGGPEIKVWDAQSGAEVGLFEGSGGTATYLALSPDGKMLAS